MVLLSIRRKKDKKRGSNCPKNGLLGDAIGYTE
jgi:hypothetical protein